MVNVNLFYKLTEQVKVLLVGLVIVSRITGPIIGLFGNIFNELFLLCPIFSNENVKSGVAQG